MTDSAPAMTRTKPVRANPYRQKYALYLLVVCTRLITGLISSGWQEVRGGQYFALLISYLLSLTGAWAVSFLCRRAKKPLFDAIRCCCGRWVGGIIALVFLLFLIHNAQNLLYTLGNITVVRALPNVSSMIIILWAAAAAAVAAFCGLEALGRFSRLTGKVIFAMLIISLLLPFENYNAAYLFPLLGNGPASLTRLGISAGADFFGVMLFGLIYDPKQDDRHFTRAMFLLPTCAFGICILFFLSTALMFPYSANGTVPLFDLLSVISAGRHVQTLASLFSFLWTGAFLVTSSAQLSFGTYAAETVLPALGTKRKWVILGMTALVCVFAMLDNSRPHTLPVVKHYGWLLLYLPLWLCALTAALRRRPQHSAPGAKETA
jgi:hypothetical protein